MQKHLNSILERTISYDKYDVGYEIRNQRIHILNYGIIVILKQTFMHFIQQLHQH